MAWDRIVWIVHVTHIRTNLSRQIVSRVRTEPALLQQAQVRLMIVEVCLFLPANAVLFLAGKKSQGRTEYVRTYVLAE